MQIGWHQPLDVSGLTWTEPQELGGRQLASVDHINTTKALLDIVRGGTMLLVSQRLKHAAAPHSHSGDSTCKHHSRAHGPSL